jgi:hypothetical protein
MNTHYIIFYYIYIYHVCIFLIVGQKNEWLFTEIHSESCW